MTCGRLSDSTWTIPRDRKKQSLGKLLGTVSKSARSAASRLTEEVTRRQKSKEEKQEEKLGRLATDITNTDGLQVCIVLHLYG